MERRRTEEAIDAAILIKFATTIDPYSLTPREHDNYAEVHRPSYEAEIVSAWKEAGLKPSSTLRTTEKLWQGIGDVTKIVHCALDDYPMAIPESEAIKIARHDTSVETIAHAAQLREKELRDTIYRQQQYNKCASGPAARKWGWSDPIVDSPERSRRFIIDDEVGAIVQNPDFDESWEWRDPSRGCPFAHGEARRPKAFDTFVRWAGTLAVRIYYENKKDAS